MICFDLTPQKQLSQLQHLKLTTSLKIYILHKANFHWAQKAHNATLISKHRYTQEQGQDQKRI